MKNNLPMCPRCGDRVTMSEAGFYCSRCGKLVRPGGSRLLSSTNGSGRRQGTVERNLLPSSHKEAPRLKTRLSEPDRRVLKDLNVKWD